MPAFAILQIIAQVYFGVHAVRTGRERWLFLIVFLPLVGCLIYFFSVYLPELQTCASINRKRSFSPKDLKRWEAEVEMTPTPKNKQELAVRYLHAGLHEKAISLYTELLQGLHRGDPSIMEGLAAAHFLKEDYARAREELERIREERGEVRGDEFDLLYARALEELGLLGPAAKEYEILLKRFSGEEARYRYGLLLRKLGRAGEAEQLFKETLKNASLLPRFYRREHKKWINLAKKELSAGSA